MERGEEGGGEKGGTKRGGGMRLRRRGKIVGLPDAGVFCRYRRATLFIVS